MHALQFFFSQICCNAINNAVDTIILLNYLYNFYNHKLVIMEM